MYFKFKKMDINFWRLTNFKTDGVFFDIIVHI